jgi:hypothetical protein
MVRTLSRSTELPEFSRVPNLPIFQDFLGKNYDTAENYFLAVRNSALVSILKKINSSEGIKIRDVKVKNSAGKIFLYFSAPVINNQTLDFINNKLYLNNDYWKLNSKNIISSNDLLFLDNNIKFIISNNNDDDFNIS